MNKNPMDQWIQKASNQMKTNPKAVKEAINNGDVSKLTASMSRADMEKVQAVLNDKQKMQELLNSPMGKKFLSQFQK